MHSPRPAAWDACPWKKHFRRFLGRSPGEVRRGFCLEQARRELLQTPRVSL